MQAYFLNWSTAIYVAIVYKKIIQDDRKNWRSVWREHRLDLARRNKQPITEIEQISYLERDEYLQSAHDLLVR